MKRRCGAVQEVIDLSSDDESTNVRPTGKLLKKELTPVPSSEVIDLRQKVVKLEKDFKGACRYARQFELRMEEGQKRIEFLENILDKKPANIDNSDKKRAEELQKKLDETSMRLEEERVKSAKQEEQYVHRLEESSEELKEARSEAAVKVLQLKRFESQFEESKTRVEYLENIIDKNPAQIDDSDKKLAEEPRKKLDEISMQLEDERKKAVKLEEQHVQKVEELMRLVVEYKAEFLLQQQQQPELIAMQQLQLQSPPTSPEIPAIPTSINPARFLIPPPPDDNCWTNIFWPAHPTAMASIQYGKAVKQLQFLVTARDAGWKYRYEEAVRRESLYCCLCGTFLTDIHILPHFFSPNHANKLNQNAIWRVSAVSLAAFDHWQRKLQSIQQPPQAPPPTSDVVIQDANDVEISAID